MEGVLAESYQRCRALHRAHGRTYYLATRLLPREKRRHVHALYGFTRYADEIVDAAGAATPDERAGALKEWSERFLAGLAGAPVDDPILPAVLHTIRAYDLDHDDFARFLASMAMDLTVTRYETYDDLLGYMDGSAAAVGTMMLPILGPRDRAAATGPARQLGLAFQLTNFIRDVREDLTRGRIYLPLADLRRFGIGEADLFAAGAAGVTPPEIRDLIRYETGRAQRHYALARPGIGMLARSSQACMRTAYLAYGAILDEVARSGYDVLAARAVVPTSRRLKLAATSLLGRGDLPVPGPVLPG
ncbi:MAG TPA: phytoene/squalene synthase family protein [Rugosimonospora sp.]|nr:phytoene/squalene synthase family protein [Rugosimonospora sp.]